MVVGLLAPAVSSPNANEKRSHGEGSVEFDTLPRPRPGVGAAIRLSGLALESDGCVRRGDEVQLTVSLTPTRLPRTKSP